MNNKYLSKKDIYSDFFNSNIINDIFEKQKNIFEEVCIETDIDKICLYYNKGSLEDSFEELFKESFEKPFEESFEESFEKPIEKSFEKPIEKPIEKSFEESFELKIISIDKKV